MLGNQTCTWHRHDRWIRVCVCGFAYMGRLGGQWEGLWFGFAGRPCFSLAPTYLVPLGLLHWHLHYTALYGMARTRNTSKGWMLGLVVCVRAFAQLLVALCG
jgi:hypothetical protein